MILVVDRSEGEYIVCENCDSKEIVNLDRTIFPAEIRSGDKVEFVDGTITVLNNDEEKKLLEERMNKLWK